MIAEIASVHFKQIETIDARRCACRPCSSASKSGSESFHDADT
jgi:hypothetical protein